MDKKEVISGLKDLIIDRESFINDNDKDNIFAKDKKILEEAVKLIENSIPTSAVEEHLEKYKTIAEKADKIPTTVKEEKLDGSYVYSQRFNADGYIAQIVVDVLQELLQEKGGNNGVGGNYGKKYN